MGKGSHFSLFNTKNVLIKQKMQIKQASANLLKVFEKFDFGSRVI